MSSSNGSSPHPAAPKPSPHAGDAVNIPLLMLHVAPNARLDFIVGYMRQTADRLGIGVAAIFSGIPLEVYPGQSLETVTRNFAAAEERMAAEARRSSLILPGMEGRSRL